MPEERKLIQHVTSHLQRSHYRELEYPKNHDTINDSYDKLRDLRELMYKLVYPKDNKVRKVRDIVLIVYNMSTKITTDIYLELKPPFQLIVQSPMVLYGDDREDVTTVYEYAESDNEVQFHNITPFYYNLNNVALEVIRDMKRGEGNIVVLGPEDKVINEDIYYVNDLSKIPNNVSIVIDTMLNDKYEYINFSESIDRLFSFENVFYYRLMDPIIFGSISMGNEIDKYKIILEALSYDERLRNAFSIDDMDRYNKKIENFRLSDNDKKYMALYDLNLQSSILYTKAARSGMNKATYAFLSILFSNVDYVKGMISYPSLTDDDSFNELNRLRTIKLIKENFGLGLTLYITLLRRIVDTIEKEEEINKESFRQMLYNMLQDNHIDSRIVSNIFSKMMNSFNIEINEIRSLTIKDYDVRKFILSIYGHRKMKLVGTLYYEGNEAYTIDTYYVPQDFTIRPETIIPLVVDENAKVVYLFL